MHTKYRGVHKAPAGFVRRQDSLIKQNSTTSARGWLGLPKGSWPARVPATRRDLVVRPLVRCTTGSWQLRMGKTAAAMRSKRGSPHTRAKPGLHFGAGEDGQSMQASPAPQGVRRCPSAGDKGEACGWERTLVDEPVVPFGDSQGTRAGEQQRVVPRPSQHQHVSLYGKGWRCCRRCPQWRQRSSRGFGRKHEVLKDRRVSGRRKTCHGEYFAAQKVVKLWDTLVTVDCNSSIG